MGAMASQITSPAIVYTTVYSDADQRTDKFPAQWPVTRKIFPFDDVMMVSELVMASFTDAYMHRSGLTS